MPPFVAETHFMARQQAVAEMFFHFCIGEGFRNADVMESTLARVSREPGGGILARGHAIEVDDAGHLLLLSPRDRAGWCVAYPSSPELGARLVELLGERCPIDEEGRPWWEHLGVEAAIHGSVRGEGGAWSWTLRRGNELMSGTGPKVEEVPVGPDPTGAFASVGRLFGHVHIDVVLHRLLSQPNGGDLEAHRLLWAISARSSTA